MHATAGTAMDEDKNIRRNIVIGNLGLHGACVSMAFAALGFGRVAYSEADIHAGSNRPSRPRSPARDRLPEIAGVATIDDSVRYPDALVTCSPITGDEHVTPNVIVVFEVIGPTSGRMDRIVKVREYAAVPSILRYVIVESASIGLMVLERRSGDRTWTVTTLMTDDLLPLPEIGIEIPVAELYEGIDFSAVETGGAPPAMPGAAGE